MTLIEKIRADIISGKFPPGSELSQTELAAAHGVSRIPIRDALHSLSSEKLVELVPGRAARVISLNPEQLGEIYDLRTMLECDLLERAMARADTADILEIEYALQKSSLEAGRPGWQTGDWLFHRALYEPAARPRQLAIIEELRTSCVIYAPKYEDLAARTENWLKDHRVIVEAYKAGRAGDACRVLREHIAAAGAHLAMT